MTAPPLQYSTTELIASAKLHCQTGFLTELDVRWISVTHEWELLEDLIWLGTKGDVIIVPKGFRTDFASTPRFLYPIFPPTGAWTKAAVVHDFLCRGLNDYHAELERQRKLIRTTGKGVIPFRPAFDSVDTDAVFKLIMLEEGTSEVAAQFGWVGVRIGAAGNPARREGWWSTFPSFAITVAFYLFLLTLIGVVIMLWSA